MNVIEKTINNAVYKALQVNGQISITKDKSEIEKIKEDIAPFLEVVNRTINTRHKQITAEDVARGIELGSAGHYGAYKWINTNQIMTWIGLHWNDIRHYYMQNKDFDDRHEGHYVDIKEYPMAEAINFKVMYMDTTEWDEIDTKELAVHLKESLSEGMSYVRSFGFKVDKRSNLMTGTLPNPNDVRDFLKQLPNE